MTEHTRKSADGDIEFTIFTKSGGPLTKHISLNDDGTIKSDPSKCKMSRGTARRAWVAGVDELAAIIDQLRFDQALALGALPAHLPDEIAVTTNGELNGDEPNVIARTKKYIQYRSGEPALVLLDYDQDEMPPDVVARIDALGGFWGALCSVLPALRSAARVIRASTSAGLSRTDTGEKFPGSGGMHVYITARNGADAVRFLKTLHDRCHLAGLGWYRTQ